MFDNGDKLACLGRELALRRNAYPKWVASGRMKQEQADREIAIIEAIIEDYKIIRYRDQSGVASPLA